MKTVGEIILVWIMASILSAVIVVISAFGLGIGISANAQTMIILVLTIIGAIIVVKKNKK